MAGIVACGIFLRLYSLQDEILLDDEWHKLNYVIDQSYSFLLSNFAVPGASSIPMNLYAKLLLDGPGWSETLLRLPSILAGIMSLVILPWLVRRLHGFRAALVFAALLATSPFLVFYSRVGRPYSAVLFLSATSMFLGWMWVSTGRRRYATGWAVTGALSVWLHLFSAVAVFTPVATLLVLRLLFPASDSFRMKVRSRSIAWTMLAAAAIIEVAVLPGFVESLQGSMSALIGRGRLTAGTFTGFTEQLGGTSHPSILVAMFAAAAAGLWTLCRRAPGAAAGIVATGAGYFLLILIVRPNWVHTPIVFSRYVIPLFVVFFLLCAVGTGRLFDAVCGKSRRADGWLSGLAILLCVALIAAGPLPGIARSTVNFSLHSAFHESYSPPEESRSYISQMVPAEAPFTALDLTVTREEAPAFYLELGRKSGDEAIIEYPMLIGDHLNVLYFYQQLHGRRVVIGYFPALDDMRRSNRGAVHTTSIPGTILSRVENTSSLRFRNMVDITDIAALRKAGAFLVLHKSPLSELDAHMEMDPWLDSLVPMLREWYGGGLGDPVYEDDKIVVYATSGAPDAEAARDES